MSIHELEVAHDRIVRKRGSFRKALKSIRSLTENDVKVIMIRDSVIFALKNCREKRKGGLLQL